MDDNRLAEMAKNEKQDHPQATWIVFKTLMRKKDINITEEQALDEIQNTIL